MINLKDRYFWSISQKTFAYMLLIIIIATVFFSSIYAYLDYKSELARAREQIDIIKTSYLPSLARSMWELNSEVQSEQVEGILSLKYINHVKIIDYSNTENKGLLQLGYPMEDSLQVYLPIVWNSSDLGQLSFQLNEPLVIRNALQNYVYLLALQFVTAFSIALLFFLLITRSLTLRIKKIYKHIIHTRKNKKKPGRLHFGRDFLNYGSRPDEIETVILELNRLSLDSHKYLCEIEDLNDNLEYLVEKRTLKLKQAIADLKKAQAQIISKEKLATAGHLSAGLAHEIKNPSYVISGSVSVLKEMWDEILEEIHKEGHEGKALVDKSLIEDNTEHISVLLRSIEDACQSVNNVISTMLSITGGESHEMELANPNELIDKVVGFTQKAFKHKTDLYVEIEQSYEPDLKEIFLYIDDFSRMIINIVENALDAMFEKSLLLKDSGYLPKLYVQTRCDQDRLIITIQDNGTGIPKDLIKKIHEPFFTTKAKDGTGLGLSLATEVAARHNGSIEVKSTTGKMTKLTVTIQKISSKKEVANAS